MYEYLARLEKKFRKYLFFYDSLAFKPFGLEF